MGISIHYDSGTAGDGDVIPLAGQSELKRLWKPIVAANDLHLLEHTLSAGLQIDSENYDEFLRQFRILLHAIESATVPDRNAADIIRRCRSLVDLLTRFPPGSNVSIYVG